MTDPVAAQTPTAGLWRRLWRFIEACEMSSAEYRDLRIDALERRVAELRQARGPAPDHDASKELARSAEQR